MSVPLEEEKRERERKEELTFAEGERFPQEWRSATSMTSPSGGWQSCVAPLLAEEHESRAAGSAGKLLKLSGPLGGMA